MTSDYTNSLSSKRDVVIPYSWINQIEVLKPEELREHSSVSRIKNTSRIDNVEFNQKLLDKILLIFSNSYAKIGKSTYIFGFEGQKETDKYFLTLKSRGKECYLEIEACSKDTQKILSHFLQVLHL